MIFKRWKVSYDANWLDQGVFQTHYKVDRDINPIAYG